MKPEPVEVVQLTHSRRQTLPAAEEDERYQIEPLARTHLPQMVPVLSQAFPTSPLVALGPRFLKELLGSYVALPGGCGYVCLHGQELVGFVVGTEDSGRHRRELLRRRWAPILLYVLHGLAVSPRHVGQLAGYLRSYLRLLRPTRPTHQGNKDVAAVPPPSLVLLGVSPAHRRRGIAARLTRAFLDEMAARGMDAVKLAVASDNEAALAFYLSRGWGVAGRHPSPEGNIAYRLIYRLA